MLYNTEFISAVHIDTASMENNTAIVLKKPKIELPWLLFSH